MLDKLLSNPIIKSAVLGKLTGLFSEHNLTVLVLTIDDKGELKIEPHKEPMTVIKTEEYNKMVESLKSLL